MRQCCLRRCARRRWPLSDGLAPLRFGRGLAVRTTSHATAAAQRCRVICTLPGDFLSPCVISSIDGGKAMGDALNTVPVDYVCFGNHEFDWGLARCEELCAQCDFPWIMSNADWKATGAPLGNGSAVGHKRIQLLGAPLDKYATASSALIAYSSAATRAADLLARLRKLVEPLRLAVLRAKAMRTRTASG